VSGTIAAASTLAGSAAVGVAGEAPAVKLLPVKVLDCTGSGEIADIVNGLEFAASHGAKVINMSFGGYTNNDLCPTSLQHAIDDVWNAGALPVAAAGNDGADASLNPYPNFPAGCNHVLAVAADDPNAPPASLSPHNGTVAIA